MLVAMLLIFRGPIPSGLWPLPRSTDRQDASAVEADFQELETSTRVQDWDTTSRLADKTLRDFRGFLKSSRVSELSDTERALAASMTHLHDIEESAASDRQGEVEHDWKDFHREYEKLKDSARKGPQSINLAPVDSELAVLQGALDAKNWSKAKSSAADARRMLRAAFPPAVLDPIREKIGACETHLQDVQEATDQRISTEVGTDAGRAKAEWESLRRQMSK